jgi:hypothetical protein
MPVCFVLLGLFVVNTLNAWRRHRDGDECVYLETVEGPGSENLPKQARTVVYDKPPLKAESPDAITRLEGSLAIADYESAVEILGEMDDAVRSLPQVLKLRIQLADETGKHDLANRLRIEAGDH